ncbi:bZIP transcription factor ABI5 homolog [Vitis riparia]|uniref:bZIP transcription factor ABI5 homolog n=1 Tax=Vitis riparia TaxID=96939 RepID=UPI00155A1813|nr:bZIP transcription factor ABI5 homolog [Vitis riparia]
MFPVFPNSNEGKSVQLSPLSLGAHLQGAQQFQTPSSLVSDMIQPANFVLSGNWENAQESLQNWMRMKSLRNKEKTSLSIGNGSGSSQFPIHRAGNVLEPMGSAGFGVGHGGAGDGHQRELPHQVINGFSMVNPYEVNAEKQAVQGAHPYHQFINMFSPGNGSTETVINTADADATETAAAEKIRRRMIKNRESAARSRARKLAYDAQQQIEIAKLKKENEFLRRIIRVLLTVIKKKTSTGYRVTKDLLRAAINVVKDADRHEIIFPVPNM